MWLPSTLFRTTTTHWLFYAVMMLFFANAKQEKEIGLGMLKPADEGLLLPPGSRIIKEKSQLDEYKKIIPNDKSVPCNVDIHYNGDIEVFYDELASENGCSMDMVVNKKTDDEIEFVAKIVDDRCISIKDNTDGFLYPNDVVAATYGNSFPFSFNVPNDDIKKYFSEGPYDGEDSACADKGKCNEYNGRCLYRTMLEIGWDGDDTNKNYTLGHLHPVGEPVARWYTTMISGKMDVVLKWKSGLIDAKISESGVDSSTVIDFPGMDKEQPVCIKPEDALQSPPILNVNSNEEDFKDKQIISLHLYPQKTIRYHTGIEGAWNVAMETPGPNKPDCSDVSFIFSSEYAAGLLITGPHSTTGSTSTTGPMESTSTTGPMESTSTTGPMESTSPSGQSPVAQSKTWIYGLAIGGGVILLIVVGIVIYCCYCRGEKSDTLEDEEENKIQRGANEDVELANPVDKEE